MEERKPSLLIVELDYHAEILRVICPILARRFSLVLWVTDKIWAKVALPESFFAAVWVMPKKANIDRYVQTQKITFDQFDFVYFNTLESHFRFFSRLRPTCATVIRLHNVNASLLPWQSIDWSVANWPAVLSYCLGKIVLQQQWRLRRELYRRASALMLPNTAILQRTEKRVLSPPAPFARYSLPFCRLPETGPCTTKQSPLTIAVTGTVDCNRKNYSQLYRAIELYKSQQSQPLRLLFLGGPQGRTGIDVIRRFQSLVGGSFEFEAAEGYVPEEQVQKALQGVHFLVAPIQLHTRYKIFKEFYGQTKMSGIENDIVRYRKPALLPKGYLLPEPLQPVCAQYEGAHGLYKAIVAMASNQTWLAMTDQFDGLHAYREDAIAEAFWEFSRTLNG